MEKLKLIYGRENIIPWNSWQSVIFYFWNTCPTTVSKKNGDQKRFLFSFMKNFKCRIKIIFGILNFYFSINTLNNELQKLVVKRYCIKNWNFDSPNCKKSQKICWENMWFSNLTERKVWLQKCVFSWRGAKCGMIIQRKLSKNFSYSLKYIIFLW